AEVVCEYARLAFVAQFLGRRMAYTYEVVTYIRGERLIMRTAEGPFPMETQYAWFSLPGGGTRMTMRNLGSPSGFSKLVAPFLALAIRRANKKDLALLKRVLEQAR
ncbi:MAG: ATPase, partial [Bryobacteraceae bacterium]